MVLVQASIGLTDQSPINKPRSGNASVTVAKVSSLPTVIVDEGKDGIGEGCAYLSIALRDPGGSSPRLACVWERFRDFVWVFSL